ncbi:MAG: M1 family aminopeptidase, partial [Planctomycetota bacterium]
LYQDVSAGEKEGEIHNFLMSAHVGTDGVYLDEGGYWYPLVELAEEADPELSLADCRLAADPINGFELVAGLELESGHNDGRLHWNSPFPLERIVLLGGPRQRWTRQHGNVTLHAVLDPDKEQVEAVAQDILDASAEYLDKYQPLIGPYPFTEFTLLEAFFSSGFAFPTCTQIVGSQLTIYKQHRRHGYIDHELLHNWWGNGIYVDPQDGNWCEALASYGANYYGCVLDGDEKSARKKRRDQSNFLSAIKPKDDKPLGTYGQEDGAGRGIAYQKGAAVFHMIECMLGKEAFFAGLRRLTAERMGKFTNWDHIREAFEQESSQNLSVFFEQWVRGGGAPLLELSGADWAPGSSQLTVWVTQGETDFTLDVPLRLYYGDRSVDVVVTVDEPEDKVVVPCESSGLTAVELDPDYHVFRKLKPSEAMPTSSLTKRGKKLLIVTPDREFPEPYQKVIDNFTEAVVGHADEPKEGHEVLVRTVDTITSEDLTEANVLVIDTAARHPAVQEFLGRTNCPVTWTDSGFGIEGQEYAGPGQAIFFTLHHPDQAGGGVTVYHGNSEAALANAGVLSYYGNSLLAFETPIVEGPADGSPAHRPHTEVIRRMDFEFHDRIEF